MKRTTERADLSQKDTPEYISGCRQFEGEDLGKFISNILNLKMRLIKIKRQIINIMYLMTLAFAARKTTNAQL